MGCVNPALPLALCKMALFWSAMARAQAPQTCLCTAPSALASRTLERCFERAFWNKIISDTKEYHVTFKTTAPAAPAPVGPARLLMFSAACLAGACFPLTSANAKTLGFIVTAWNTAVYETKFWDECPDGPAIGNDEFWWRALSKADRSKLTDNGLIETPSRRETAQQRGPNLEDVCWNPEIVKDPPLREVQGKISYGANLDGKVGGEATPNTCAHQEFTSPTGEQGIDNQLYRVLGCQIGWRSNGILDRFGNQERNAANRSLILIEVSGVDDPRNDPDVDLTFYKAMDLFVTDVTGEIMPGGSYRVDMDQGTPRYGSKAKGSIENGVIKARSAEVRLPYYANEGFSEIVLRDMQFTFEMSADGRKAQGQMAGYYDIDKWWQRLTNTQYYSAASDFSCPDIYEAIHRLADGYPDPKTGKCTAISSAFKVEAVSAFVIHPTADEKKTSAAGGLIQTARKP